MTSFILCLVSVMVTAISEMIDSVVFFASVTSDFLVVKLFFSSSLQVAVEAVILLA